ncbi:MAG TPA: TonB-dependent receptor [Verrucomicrobiota bacterium]|nr:TonB-dependent receptor [Verrucomicrobiota bacterium]
MFNVQGQESGTVSGIVVSTWDGAPLPGVVVSVRGTTLATQTDSGGRYELRNVPPGDQVLRFSKSGHASVVVTEVRVLAGQTTTVNGNLRPEFHEMEEYEVTAELFTEQTEKILFERQKASGLMDAIGSETISKMGSSHAADVVTKVAGSAIVEGKYAVVRGLNDRYVPTLMNGAVVPTADPYRKSASLDQFPSAIIDQVVITKTFTPDQPGNFTGGGVDVITKTFPEKGFAKFSAGAGYNSQATGNKDFLTYDGGDTDWLGMDDGTRELPSDLSPGTTVPFPEVLTPIPGSNPDGFARSVERANTLNDQTLSLGTAQFAPHTSAPPPDQNFAMSFGNTVKLREVPVGFLGGFNYKREYRFYEDGQQQRLRSGDLVKSDYDDTRSLTTVNWAGMASIAARFWENHEVGFNFLYSQTSQDTARLQSGVQVGSPDDTTYQDKLQYIERNLTSYQLKGSSVFPDWNGFKVDYLFGLTDTSQDEPDTRQFNYVQVGTNYYTGGNFLPDPQDPTRYYANLEESSSQGKVDLTLPINLWSGLEGVLKAGWSGIYTDRDFWERQFSYRGAAPWVGGDPNDYLTDDNLGYDPTVLSNGRIRWNWQRYITAFDSSYHAESTIEAAYLMTDSQVLEPLRIIGGARVESTDIQIHSESFFENSQTGLRVNDTKLDQTDVLPAAGLVWSMRSNLLMRLNYSETIARPSFRELAAYRSYDPNLDIELEGNPNLQMTSIKNYDARLEWYLGKGDIVSVSAFYKELDLPIEQAFITLDGSIISWQNRDSAKVWGVEFEARKNLGFIDDSLEFFSVGGNYSWIKSETDLTDIEYDVKSTVVPGADKTRPLSEQSPYIFNADISYSNPHIGSTISVVYNVIGPRLIIASLTTEDVYEQPASVLDVVYSQRITKNLSARFTAKNLLDPERELTYGEDGGPVFSKFRTGRTFSLSLSYDF